MCVGDRPGVVWDFRPGRGPRVARFTPNEVERVQGFPSNRTLPQVNDEGKRSDSLRYHAVGNAVTPPVAEWVDKRLAKAIGAFEAADRTNVGGSTSATC